jgi:hypothetical protein
MESKGNYTPPMNSEARKGKVSFSWTYHQPSVAPGPRGRPLSGSPKRTTTARTSSIARSCLPNCSGLFPRLFPCCGATLGQCAL